MEKTTLYLPPDLHERLKAIARYGRRSQAAVVRDALEEYADRQEEIPLRSIGSVETSDLHGAEVDDWLVENWHPDRDWGRDQEAAKEVDLPETAPAEKQVG